MIKYGLMKNGNWYIFDRMWHPSKASGVEKADLFESFEYTENVKNWLADRGYGLFDIVKVKVTYELM